MSAQQRERGSHRANNMTLNEGVSSLSLSASSHRAPSQRTELPGDLAVWIFIFAELTVFAIFFFCYSWMHSHNIDMFRAGQENLHPIAGLINTVALITSSYTVALAVLFARRGSIRLTRYGLIASVLLGMIYVVTKLWEYGELIEAGFNLSTNNFYMFYFFTTGFHFMHVLLGLVILSIMVFRLNSLNTASLSETEQLNLESSASYWHMVDLLWIILFPLVYVL